MVAARFAPLLRGISILNGQVLARSAKSPQVPRFKRVRREALAEALRNRRITPTERRLVEFIAEHVGAEHKLLTIKEVCAGADMVWASFRVARRKAIAHGFITVDAHRRPFIYGLDERWLA